jgi:DNA-binding transcriptional MerR regulator
MQTERPQQEDKTQVYAPEDDARLHIMRAQRLLVLGDYGASLQENQRALRSLPNSPPADEALFNMACIYGHPRNPKRDQGRAMATFRTLKKEYPQSPLSEQATAWMEVFQENEKMKKAVTDISQENERLKRTSAELAQENAKLKQIIEQSKKVDIEIEEKKREKAR